MINVRITCGLYVNIILNDFVGTLLDIPDLDTAWLLDPYVGGSTESLGNEWIPTPGNQVSCEFSLLSQCWHMLMSDRDEKWMKSFMTKVLPGISPADPDFQRGVSKYLDSLEADPGKRRCGNLLRNSDGTFDNEALLKVLSESTQDCAGKIICNQTLTCRRFQLGNTQDPERICNTRDPSLAAVANSNVERISYIFRFIGPQDIRRR